MSIQKWFSSCKNYFFTQNSHWWQQTKWPLRWGFPAMLRCFGPWTPLVVWTGWWTSRRQPWSPECCWTEPGGEPRGKRPQTEWWSQTGSLKWQREQPERQWSETKEKEQKTNVIWITKHWLVHTNLWFIIHNFILLYATLHLALLSS